MQGFKRFCWGNIVVGSLEWLNSDEDIQNKLWLWTESQKEASRWCVPILEHLKCIYEEFKWILCWPSASNKLFYYNTTEHVWPCMLYSVWPCAFNIRLLWRRWTCPSLLYENCAAAPQGYQVLQEKNDSEMSQSFYHVEYDVLVLIDREKQ